MKDDARSGTRVVIPRGATECQECGYLGVAGSEFHSYESCILYMLKTNPARIKDKHRNYIWAAGKKAMQERVDRQEVPEW